MTHDEWAAARLAAGRDPVAYCTKQGIFRLETLPDGLREGWCRFWLFGIWPGSFLSAVIRNDLIAAARHADHTNALFLTSIANWFGAYADQRAIGKNAEAWAEKGGHFGNLRKEARNG